MDIIDPPVWPDDDIPVEAWQEYAPSDDDVAWLNNGDEHDEDYAWTSESQDVLAAYYGG